MDNKKKMAAAISAVMNYIKTQEEAICMQAATAPAPVFEQSQPPFGQKPPVPMKLWGISGRQAQMQMRNMMEMKAFHRLKLR